MPTSICGLYLFVLRSCQKWLRINRSGKFNEQIVASERSPHRRLRNNAVSESSNYNGNPSASRRCPAKFMLRFCSTTERFVSYVVHQSWQLYLRSNIYFLRARITFRKRPAVNRENIKRDARINLLLYSFMVFVHGHPLGYLISRFYFASNCPNFHGRAPLPPVLPSAW